MDRILVIGASGQLGTELTVALRKVYGTANVVASDLRPGSGELLAGPFEQLDVLNGKRLAEVVSMHGITQVYHLAAILSAYGEQHPQKAWQINMDSLLNVLEVARELKLQKVYWPSSIAVFGPDTPKVNTPQHTLMNPTTVYGISKLAGERWCAYYHNKYGVDVRSLRYPGLIGYKSLPGGGTTDYAVDIFHKALETGTYTSFLSADTCLPMMYMPDAVKATIDLMHADAASVKVRSSYNIGAISFTPRQLAIAIQHQQPDFTVSYAPDYRQQIADSWPDSIDDSAARHHWNWQHRYDLNGMTMDILANLKAMKEQALA